MVQFRLFGIPITIHPMHWVVLVFIGGGIDAVQGLVPIINVAVFVIAGFISILIHELGHALAIKKYGLPTEIHLIAFGGFATYPVGATSRKQSFLITAAGPAVQIVLGLAAIAVLRYVELPDTAIRIFVFDLAWVSIVWAVLNCLPVFPMDGGHMLLAILGPRREATAYLTGVIVAVACIIAALVFLPGKFLLHIFLAIFAWDNWQRYGAVKS